eukprot:CAMPEP_0176500070 /NCGR_PEP_ID=MMETSP0200_2-20121128/13309_1 /TAXON_ID=947934 /ORGANISM="Chaetoceros sp., Strain GSL56" /LENGTH=921 /DNA_ID=CAMNT_0017898621 /DNA_START=306 /DNA_END=3070 /DNA_ORIENTATION=-
MILAVFPCLNSTTADTNNVTNSRARLHPFLEEFLLCAASKFCHDGSDEPRAKQRGENVNDDDCHGDHNGDNHVYIQVAYPQAYYFQEDNNIDSHDLPPPLVDEATATAGTTGAATIIRKYFHIDKIHPDNICNVQDLSSKYHDMYQLKVTLQYICSTSEDYDVMFSSQLSSSSKAPEQIRIGSLLKKSLEYRTIKKGCFLAVNDVNLPMMEKDDRAGILLLRVCDLKFSSSLMVDKDDHQGTLVEVVPQPQPQPQPHSIMDYNQCYFNLGSCCGEHYCVELEDMMTPSLDKSEEEETSKDRIQVDANYRIGVTTCPGYESLVDEIVELANISISGGSPSGVAILGCSGVGKTRLAMAVSNRLMTAKGSSKTTGQANIVVSAMDILLEASSWMDLEHLKRYIFKHVFHCESTGRSILVIDALDVIFDNDNDENDFMKDDEKRFARHAVIGVMDELHAKQREKGRNGPSSFILGISSRDTMRQSVDLAKVGRFEKFITMSPPTESQRIEILKSMFQSMPIDCSDRASSKIELCETWSTIIARYTSGCVAADLKRICVDASTRSRARVDKELDRSNDITAATIQWSDIREAARDCVPSQLSHLDVTLARSVDVDFTESVGSPRDSFFKMWNAKFAGYGELKAKVYRTIIWPWKRQVAFSSGTYNRMMTDLERDVPPPTGVLFYGPSGTGKTFAAECLACSLGLNVIRVSVAVCMAASFIHTLAESSFTPHTTTKVRATDVLDQWLGGSEAIIRALFARARSAAPCALFFDDLDAIAANRENDGDSNDVYARLLSTLLNEIDGISGSNALNGILIVGTTNRIQAIDAALLRPGRFEEHLLLDLPSVDDIEEMLKMFLEKVPMDCEVNLHDIAELLEELKACAADVKGLCSEACLNAISKVDESTNISQIALEATDFDEVIDRWKQ